MKSTIGDTLKTIRITADFTYDDNMFDENDPEAKAWFKDILFTDELSLHSDDIGDFIGEIKIIKVENL